MKTRNLTSFREEFPDEKACLKYVFEKKYSYKCSCKGRFYASRTRKCYACGKCGKQVFPLKGTIFHKSRTPLTSWFFLIYLFSISKNGVAATEAKRLLGVTEKTAWRMCKLIRSLMTQEEGKLTGTVEVDETYIGGRRRLSVERTHRNKTVVLGMVKRKGALKVFTIPDRSSASIVPVMKKHIDKKAKVVTDEYKVYTTPGGLGFRHRFVKHGAREYVRKTTHTNSIEGAWGQIKRSLHGTHHMVSKQHLNSYLQSFVFRYNASRLCFDPLERMLSHV